MCACSVEPVGGCLCVCIAVHAYMSMCTCAISLPPPSSRVPVVHTAKQKPAEKPSAAGGEQDALPTHVEPMQVASAKVQQYSKCSVAAVGMHTSGESVARLEALEQVDSCACIHWESYTSPMCHDTGVCRRDCLWTIYHSYIITQRPFLPS